MAQTPFSGLYGATKKPKRPKAPGTPGYQTDYMAGGGMGEYAMPSYEQVAKKNPTFGQGGNIGGYDALFDFPDMQGGMFEPPARSIEGWETGTVGAPGGQGSMNVWEKPDYSGILNQYTTDWRARLNSGLASMQAQRLSRARGAINRLGVRDPQGMAAKLSKYGITAADLQAAADNPWSELKAIQQQADRSRGQGEAEFAARGGFRSGGTSQMLEDVEQNRARTEAMATEETLGGISEDAFNAAEWERQQRDELDSRAADLEASLAQAYQPYQMEATWDQAAGGYRAPNGRIYNAQGQVIG